MLLSFVVLLTGLGLALIVTRNKRIALVVSCLFGLYLAISVFYYFANRLTGDGVNESFFYHVQADFAGAGLWDFLPFIAWFFGSLFLCMVAGVLAYRVLRKAFGGSESDKKWGLISPLILLLSIVIHPLSYDLQSHFFSSSEAEFATHYVFPEIQPPASASKNIVYIYLESLERTYLDESIFPGLTPELKKLEENSVTFTNLGQAWGTGWTIAGMVSSQCGIPLVTTGSGGSTMYGMSEFLPKATCLGDLLSRLDYRLSYMGGADLRFAGKGKFYSTHGFERVQGKRELRGQIDNPNYLNSWGLYDDSLFGLAWQEFLLLSGKDEPFALFLLTLDTHHPDGYPSTSCNNNPSLKFGNSMLDAVACSDWLVGSFVQKIMASEHGKNTTIVIASDHLAFPNKASSLLNKGDRQNLFFVLNSESSAPRKYDAPGSTLDIAPTLLGLMGFQSDEFALGRDLLGDSGSLIAQLEDADDALKGFKKDIRAFWKMPDLASEFVVNTNQKFMETNGERLVLPVLLKLESSDYPISENSVLIDEIFFEGYWYVELKDNLKTFSETDRFIWIDDCSNTGLIAREFDQVLSGGMCLAAGQLGRDNIFFTRLQDHERIGLDDVFDHDVSQFLPDVYEDQKQALELGKNPYLELTETVSAQGADVIVDAQKKIDAFLNQSLRHCEMGEFQACIDAANSAISLDPGNAVAYNNLCVGFNELSQFQKSVEACQRAIAIQPGFALAQNNLDWTLSRMNQANSKAMEKESRGRKENSADVLREAGLDYYRLENYASSLRCWELALKIAPNDPNNINNVAVALIALGQPQEAIRLLAGLVEENPNTELYRNNLNWAESENQKSSP